MAAVKYLQLFFHLTVLFSFVAFRVIKLFVSLLKMNEMSQIVGKGITFKVIAAARMSKDKEKMLY